MQIVCPFVFPRKVLFIYIYIVSLQKIYSIMAKKRIRIDSNTKNKFSDYTLDLSKLVFGGVILAGIMGLSVNPNILFGLGAVSVIILTLVGFVFIILKHNNRR